MPVGEDGGVHTGQIDAQPGGVVQQGSGRAGVQQDAVSLVLNHEGETVLTEEPLGAVFSIRTVTRTALTPPSS